MGQTAATFVSHLLNDNHKQIVHGPAKSDQ